MPATGWLGGDGINMQFVRTADAPLRPPPASSAGAAAWLRQNLFSSFGSTLMTVAMSLLLGFIAWRMLDWAVLRAVWTGVDRSACAIEGAGACWPFVREKFPQWLFGFYPLDERWRAVLAFLIGAALLAPMLIPGETRQKRKGLSGMLFRFRMSPVPEIKLNRVSFG